MESLLQTLAVAQVYTFMLVFVRVGTALMIMPGIGDGFVPQNVRLLFALAFSVVVSPLVAKFMPPAGDMGAAFVAMLLGEFVMGAFIGGVARCMMAALDTAGMLISMHMGLANAQIFNPAFATQGSIMGAFLSITGACLLFATNLHHLVLQALIDSYRTFPPGQMSVAMAGNMADTFSNAVTKSFAVGVQFGMPFMLITMMVYVAMGILSRVMPQLQVFVLFMPVQIAAGLLIFTLVVSAGMMFWLSAYQDAISLFLLPGGG